MKHTTALFTLALATTGLAAPSIVARETQYVYIGKNANFLPSPGNAPGSDAVNIPVTVGDCTNLPTDYRSQLSAIAPNGAIKCYLYGGLDCTGPTPPGPDGLPVSGRVNDLSQPPYYFDNITQSIRCVAK